jgi:ComF family protein
VPSQYQSSLESIQYPLAYSGEVKDLLKRAKFGSEWAIVDDFADLLSDLVAATKLETKTAICFIPPDPKRLAKRGYHVPKLLATKLGAKLNLDVLDILEKTISTAPQIELKRKDRLANLSNVFALKSNLSNSLSKYDRLIIVDDIVTTSTTLGRVSELLVEKFPFLKIQAVVIAH